MENLLTPIGTAMWAKVNTVIDVNPQGKRTFQIKLELPETDEKAMIAMLQKEYKAFQELPENEGKEWRHKPRLGFKPDKTTKKNQFMFWTYAERTNSKTKEKTPAVIPVYTKFGERIDMKAIGNGSLVQVGYKISPYHQSEDANGLALNLLQIMVHDLKEFGGTPDAPMFKFETFVPPTDTEEISF